MIEKEINWSFWHNADDIAVAVSSDPRNGRRISGMCKVVKLLDIWLEENDFHQKHRCQDPDIRLRGIEIQVVNNTKFLGVTFDSKLR
jgi:hypothetical protein